MTRRDCTPDEIERLWDAFEGVDRAAGKIAYGGSGTAYVKVHDRLALRSTLDVYRRARDEIDLAREEPSSVDVPITTEGLNALLIAQTKTNP